MRRRPWPLIILAVLHLIAPIGNIIFNAYLLDRSIPSYFVYALSPEYLVTNWVIIVAPIVAGFSIYSCKRWSFFVYLVSITALFVFSYEGYHSKSHLIGLLPVILVYFTNILVVSYFLIPTVRNIYFDRRMRWWEIQARYKSDFKCNWSSHSSTQSHNGIVSNISINGLFLKSDELPKDKDILSIKVHFGAQVMGFKGEAIIHNRVDALGFGLKFNHDKESKKQAQTIVDFLESKGHRITQLDARPEDSFSFWLRTLLTTGKGFFPKKEK